MTDAHRVWEETAAAYLLGALRENERGEFEAHLAGCERCREDVESLRVATDALPASPPQLAPPPELKDRIMAIVNAEAELLRAAGPEADRVVAAKPSRRRFAWWPPRPAIAVAATVIVLLAGVTVGLVSSGGGSDTRTVIAKVTLPNASAKLIVRDDDHSTLMTKGLPHPEPGRVYQVWIKHPNSDPEPTDALFDVRSDGSASVDVPGSLEGVEAVMVTSEPDGGSKAPTRQPIVIASPT